MTPGPIAFVGSGEFTPATEAIDLALLEGRTRKVVFLPTAAAPKGPTTVAFWTQLGSNHYRRLGIDATPLLVLNGDDANKSDLAAQLSAAGLIYLAAIRPTSPPRWSALASAMPSPKRGTAAPQSRAVLLARWRSSTSSLTSACVMPRHRQGWD